MKSQKLSLLFCILQLRPGKNNIKQSSDNFLSGHPIIVQLLSLIPREIFKDVVE
jgi:hypothetical protein